MGSFLEAYIDPLLFLVLFLFFFLLLLLLLLLLKYWITTSWLDLPMLYRLSYEAGAGEGRGNLGSQSW